MLLAVVTVNVTQTIVFQEYVQHVVVTVNVIQTIAFQVFALHAL